MAVITQKQVLELEANASFQSVSKQFIRDYATYITQQDGTTGNLAGLTPVNWARTRYIAKGISLHPNSQNYQEWVSQFSMLLKGQNVWETDADGTVDAMIASGKFDELAALTYAIRAQFIEI